VGFLKNDGTCSTSTATPAGSNQQVQVNVSGSFGVFAVSFAGLLAANVAYREIRFSRNGRR